MSFLELHVCHQIFAVPYVAIHVLYKLSGVGHDDNYHYKSTIFYTSLTRDNDKQWQ